MRPCSAGGQGTLSCRRRTGLRPLHPLHVIACGEHGDVLPIHLRQGAKQPVVAAC